jgi:alkanesulfonate monooxygenase SsuD/methylene tetrahydromethanopterin reductase-like flavin-dependent oxidoreductase (luciferase family)
LKLLLDANVPKGLRRMLPGHQVSTAQEQSWGSTKNGDLLRAAETAGFDALITADQNIGYQQNLKERSIALIVLWTNNWSLLKPAASRISAAVDRVTAQSFQMIGPG